MDRKEMGEKLELMGEKLNEKVNNYEVIKNICSGICNDLLLAIKDGVDHRACYPYAFDNRTGISEIGYMASKNCIWGDGNMISDYLVDIRSLITLRNQEMTKGYKNALSQIRSEMGDKKLYYREGSKFVRYII